ncbi:hypothetical protein SOV_10980 [Sporomusa ovata DSM 2662]|uniref:Uncharacterized protein n=1 Tax=Sporomusa ovata TaxID=2378 RepID=A0A0U1KX05_9FIRM|nr:hypothetical protein [Sporomusa ovata]EQB28725.1 hypothetical protein SOV_1c04360 [Sporomusa ovata DSM 2662]CQR71876.1 hypothetical protein SpAn4DRAFT_4938 [Sporomusa ovata]
MADSCKVYDESGDLITSEKRSASNEVIIIIRDGKVVSFNQKSHDTFVEGRYGDGI